MKTRFVLVLGMTLVLFVAGSVSVASAGDVVVPFDARLVTHPMIVVNNGVVTVQIPAEGQSTHLGECAWYANMWINTATTPFTQGSDLMTFTAANGDELFGSYFGYFEQTPTGPRYWGTYKFSGGTGRFEGATGEGTYSGTSTPGAPGQAPGLGALYFDGTLIKRVD